MKTFRWFFASLVAAWLTWSSAHGQPGSYRPMLPPPPTIPNGDGEALAVSPHAPSGGFSNWITYQRECCEGQHGKSTPLFTELYLRAGPSVPIGNQLLSKELQTGWSIVGGGRALFFNATMDKAWTIDPHIINTNESGGRLSTPFALTVFQGPVRTNLPAVTIRASNRTMAGLGFGREWYPWQPADCNGHGCRVGWDFGGRYGSQRIDLNEARRVTDVIGSMFAAVHADIEIPCKFCLFHTGVRLEWAYTWSDVMQRTSDVQDINVLWTVGSRF